MPRRSLKSVSLPIVLTVIALSLSIAMLVAWTLVIAQAFLGRSEHAGGIWLMVLGILSFVTVMTVLVIFGISLVRQVLESRRQVSFIDSVTHELKSPLASLKLCLQTLARSSLDESQRVSLHRMMEADVGRLSSFIDDVLHASRAMSGRPNLVISEVRLDDLLRRTALQAAARYRADPLAIIIDVDGGLVLSTDRASLQVIIDNLVDNAVKYSEGAMDVRVRAEVLDDGRVSIEVIDKGIGITKKDLRQVFDRFFRAPEESVRARRGTGLGLFVASAMVKNIGGRIHAESKGLGEGTTMRVTLPASSVVRLSEVDEAQPLCDDDKELSSAPLEEQAR